MDEEDIFSPAFATWMGLDDGTEYHDHEQGGAPPTTAASRGPFLVVTLPMRRVWMETLADEKQREVMHHYHVIVYRREQISEPVWLGARDEDALAKLEAFQNGPHSLDPAIVLVHFCLRAPAVSSHDTQTAWRIGVRLFSGLLLGSVRVNRRVLREYPRAVACFSEAVGRMHHS